MNTRVSSALATARRKFADGGDVFDTPDQTERWRDMNWPRPFGWEESASQARQQPQATRVLASAPIRQPVTEAAPPAPAASAPIAPPSAWMAAPPIERPPSPARTGMFDDLIPKQPPATAAVARTGMFDDLIPKGPGPTADPLPDTPDADASKQSWLKYAGNNELLPVCAFGFGPFLASARAIGRIANLGNHAFAEP